jgi:hypothetical protein
MQTSASKPSRLMTQQGPPCRAERSDDAHIDLQVDPIALELRVVSHYPLEKP